MTTEEIIHGRKLIAEFEGWSILKDSDDQCFEHPESWDILHQEDFNADQDWNVIMRVWKKLQEEVADWSLEYFRIMHARIAPKFLEMGLGTADINVAFEELVKMIQWYNQNKT